jgi:hypothetical protein
MLARCIEEMASHPPPDPSDKPSWSGCIGRMPRSLSAPLSAEIQGCSVAAFPYFFRMRKRFTAMLEVKLLK